MTGRSVETPDPERSASANALVRSPSRDLHMVSCLGTSLAAVCMMLLHPRIASATLLRTPVVNPEAVGESIRALFESRALAPPTLDWGLLAGPAEGPARVIADLHAAARAVLASHDREILVQGLTAGTNLATVGLYSLLDPSMTVTVRGGPRSVVTLDTRTGSHAHEVEIDAPEQLALYGLAQSTDPRSGRPLVKDRDGVTIASRCRLTVRSGFLTVDWLATNDPGQMRRVAAEHQRLINVCGRYGLRPRLDAGRWLSMLESMFRSEPISP